MSEDRAHLIASTKAQYDVAQHPACLFCEHARDFAKGSRGKGVVGCTRMTLGDTAEGAIENGAVYEGWMKSGLRPFQGEEIKESTPGTGALTNGRLTDFLACCRDFRGVPLNHAADAVVALHAHIDRVANAHEADNVKGLKGAGAPTKQHSGTEQPAADAFNPYTGMMNL